MNKDEFLSQLRSKLSGLPEQDVEDRILFYEEMIDERIEEGGKEEDVVSDIGSPDQIADHIMSEIPLGKIVKERIKPKKKVSSGKIVLLVLTFPVWFPLLLALVAVLLSLLIALWAVVFSFYVLFLAFIISFIVSFALSVIAFVIGDIAPGIAVAGISLILASFAILVMIMSLLITKGSAFLTGKAILGIKSLLIGKGGS